MKRQVRFYGIGTALDDQGGIDPGSSGYPWENSPSQTLYQVWNKEDLGINGAYPSYAYCWPDLGARHAMTLQVPPTLVRFSKVTLIAGFDYSQMGGNAWWFPPDNAHGPGCALMVRGRDLSTYIVGTGAAAHQFIDTDDNNVNTNTSPVPFKLYTLTWEMASHPQGGPWTFEDLRDLAVGVEFNWSNGPNGKAFDPVGTGFHKMRAPYLEALVDVEDLGGFTDNVRHTASMWLRLMRRARNIVKPDTFPHRAAEKIGSSVYFSHPRGPRLGGHGWGERRLERERGLVLARTYLPETIRVQDECIDMRPISCLGWAAYRIDGPWSPSLQGLALLDKGKGFTHARAQDAWSARPGDGVVMRVLEGYPNLSREGLAMSGGGDVAVCLRNWDLMQSGWSTIGASGTFSVATDTDVVHAEEQGYLSSCRMTYGAGGGTGGRERSLGTFDYNADERLHVRVVVRNVTIGDPDTDFAEWYLKRSGGGLAAAEYWDEGGRAWTTIPTYNSIPSDEPSGESISDAIPCNAAGATSDPTYVIAVGRFSSSMGPVTINGALVDVQHTDDTVAGARPPVVTLDATITRVADVHTMDHAWGRELWVHERGTAMVEVRTWARQADLPAGTVMPLLYADHETDTWDALQLVSVAGDDTLVRFERAISGEATYQLDCPIDGIALTRAHVVRAFARWLGPDGWTEYGPYSVEVGYLVTLEATGAVVGTGSVIGRMTSEVAVPYAQDHVGIGCDATRQLDGWVRTWETRREPLHRDECLWKL